jgi:glycosyltransferase involved in cell wall biosynthesis
MKFSVLTSAHLWNDLKKRQLARCIRSVRNQTFEDWEMIVIDDGSREKYKCEYKGIKVFSQPHFERIIAMNKAMEKANGEWFCFLNSDDEYFSYSLELMSEMIESSKDYKLFSCASLHVRQNWGTQIRGAFEPKKEKVGHEIFGPGNIVDGTFFFHRSIYEKMGAFPPEKIENVDCSELNYGGKRNLFMVNPWDFSAAAQLEFPEIRMNFQI